jgi:two-component system response regulator PilR (NtrC family)
MSHILLVEDDPDVRSVFGQVLLLAGYTVDVATTLQEARSFLETAHYDLVLTDGRLPDGTGIEVADDAVEQGSKALIVTGYSFMFPQCDLERHGFLQKPVRSAMLLRAIGDRLRPGQTREHKADDRE